MERFHDHHREVVFTQQDYLCGTPIMGKPMHSGPSLAMELTSYKAVFAPLESLPFYHYDYETPWSFGASDVNAPHDHAEADRAAVKVTVTRDGVEIHAAVPLERPIPVALWNRQDLDLESTPGRVFKPEPLEDGQRHLVLEIPKGWSGTWKGSGKIPAVSREATPRLWETVRRGDHGYGFPAFEIVRPFHAGWTLSKACRVDDPHGPLGLLDAGHRLDMKFDPRRTWYRFHGPAEEIQNPSPLFLETLLQEKLFSERFRREEQTRLQAHQKSLDAWYEQKIAPWGEVVYSMDCFGNCLLGERSRARPLDRLILSHKSGIQAREIADGGLAFGNGISGWCHPRELHVEVSGLPGDLLKNRLLSLVLFSRSTDRETRVFDVSMKVPGENPLLSPTPWTCTPDLESSDVFRWTLPDPILKAGRFEIIIVPRQRKVLDDWFRERGFVALLERLSLVVHW